MVSGMFSSGGEVHEILPGEYDYDYDFIHETNDTMILTDGEGLIMTIFNIFKCAEGNPWVLSIIKSKITHIFRITLDQKFP